MKRIVIFSLGMLAGCYAKNAIDKKAGSTTAKNNIVDGLNSLYQGITSLSNESLKTRAMELFEKLKTELSKPFTNPKKAKA